MRQVQDLLNSCTRRGSGRASIDLVICRSKVNDTDLDHVQHQEGQHEHQLQAVNRRLFRNNRMISLDSYLDGEKQATHQPQLDFHDEEQQQHSSDANSDPDNYASIAIK